MSTISLSLPDELKAFLEAEAAAGGYDSTSALVQDVLNAFWKEKAKAALEAKLVAAMDSGPPIEPTPQIWADLKARVRQRHSGNAQP
jgi:antitoxin ParD1/3/4